MKCFSNGLERKKLARVATERRRISGVLDEDLVTMLREDKLRGDADGVTVEERIIEASLRSLGEPCFWKDAVFQFRSSVSGFAGRSWLW